MLAVLGSSAQSRGQGDDVLYWRDIRFDGSDPVSGALAGLGLTGRTVGSVDTFLFWFDAQPWGLLSVRLYSRLRPDDEALVIDAFERHLDRGGRLMINIAELDEMPAMQRFLGLEGAVDLELPLREVRNSMVPLHPAAAYGFMRLGLDPIGPDFGDVLMAGPDTRTIYIFDDEDRSTASILGRDGQVIVNGWEWSEWSTGDGIGIATEQIRWLISCPADLDRSGSLDIFDFLEFQRLFDAGDPAADWFCYDGRLDVFDFLAFFNAFELPCR
jgi:hypothetical protein